MNIGFEFLADRPEAVPQIACWWFDAWGHLRPGTSVDGFTATLNEQLFRDQLPIRIVAIGDGIVVGVAELKLHEMADLYPDKEFWMGGIFVAPGFRRRGIGSALSLKIAEIAKSKCIQAIHLQTQNLNGGLYAKLGWERIEQVNYKGYEALVMVKQLDSQ